MASRTAVMERVRSHDAVGVAAALAENPELVPWRDERGRGWLHICCMAKPGTTVHASVQTADLLLDLGFDIDEAAFTEGDWRATPLWHAVGRGRNLVLAEHLLQRGANPNYCLWAASFQDDLEAIDLLVAHGANLEDPSVPGEPPFIGAISTSHFAAAERLLDHGADVNAQDGKGRTALHLMLKKSSDTAHFEMLLRYHPRGDIPDSAGVTAAEIMRRKRSPDLRAMADQLVVG